MQDTTTTRVKDFEKILEGIDSGSMPMEAYCRKYLSHLLEHKMYYLGMYAGVLNKVLQHSNRSMENISLVDVGAGNGLLGIFARYCGFGKVWLNDNDASFLEAARQLSFSLKIPVDGYITGDLTASSSSLIGIPDAVVGTDVIEHIYDLEAFLKSLQQLNPNVISVFTTGSNPENYFKVKALQKIQVRDELKGGDPSDRLLFGEKALPPFLEIRTQIIREHEAGLQEIEISRLAENTRGLNTDDIIRSISNYRNNSTLPQPAVGVNTCNPQSGSWTERILPLSEYRKIYDAAGFSCEFYPGWYNDTGKGPINLAKKMLNHSIRVLGLKISPFIVIVGTKK